MKRVLIHIGLIALTSVVLLVAVLQWMKSYTHHNDALIEVMELEGKTGDEALRILEDAELEGEIHDTVFKDGALKWEVINQNPAPGRMVKNGRKVYLVINTGKVPMVEVPDLAGLTSLTQAQNILSRRHLKVGEVIKEMHPSVHSKTDEPVLAQFHPGTREEIEAGSLVERNSKIDLLVGISSDYYDVDSLGTAGDSTLIEF